MLSTSVDFGSLKNSPEKLLSRIKSPRLIPINSAHNTCLSLSSYETPETTIFPDRESSKQLDKITICD